MIIQELVREAANVIQKNYSDGFTAADLCTYLNKYHALPNNGIWQPNMAIPGDCSNWHAIAKTKNLTCNLKEEVCPKFLGRVSALGPMPKRYRLLADDDRPKYLAPYLKEGAVYTREELARQFSITDATLMTGIYRPSGTKSIWLFVTQDKTNDRTQYRDQIEGDILHWQGQAAGKKDRQIISHEKNGDELMVFYRRSRYEYPGAGFRYEGCFRYDNHSGSAPTSFILKRIRDEEVASAPEIVSRRFWAFLANPEMYDIQKGLKSLPEDTWLVGNEKVRRDDLALIWKGNSQSSVQGVVALAQVLSNPNQTTMPESSASLAPKIKEENRVRIRYYIPPLAPLWMAGDEGVWASLAERFATGGTVFEISFEQWSAVSTALGTKIGLAEGAPNEVGTEAPSVDFDPFAEEDTRTRNIASVVQRKGQQEFREALMLAYGGRCCITGCKVDVAIEAAHIKEYRGAATNHPQNGLLLRADLHKLFDRHLLSVDPSSWTVVVSQSIRASEYGILHGQSIHLPAETAQQPSCEALQQHLALTRAAVEELVLPSPRFAPGP